MTAGRSGFPHWALALLLAGLTAAGGQNQPQSGTKGVQLIPDPANRRVDVLIDGRPFTSYIYPDRLK